MLNEACWQKEAGANVEVGPADMYTPGPGEMLVKNESIGFSPIDFKDQRYTIHAKAFPTILGTSFAGTVQSVGPDVKSFQPQDIVAVNRSDKTLGDARYGVFQKYVIASVNTAAKLVHGTPLDAAAATIINLTTMFSALSIHLELARPPLSGYPSRDTKSKNLLIYGGSSSCGGLGIKYASDAGYTVVTTSSPRNRSFVLKQGAAQVIDHTQPADAIVVELKAHGPYEAVLDCISLPGTFHIMSNLMSEKGGVIYGLLPPDGFVFPPNVEYKFFPYSWVLEEDANSHMARWFYDEYVPRGLVSGQIIPTRHVLVAGGLGNVQQTLDQMADGGVSGHKYVLNPQL